MLVYGDEAKASIGWGVGVVVLLGCYRGWPARKKRNVDVTVINDCVFCPTVPGTVVEIFGKCGLCLHSYKSVISDRQIIT